MNPSVPSSMELTPFQLLLSFLLVAVFFSVLVGCVVSWALWFSGVRPKQVARKPLATVGFIDVLMTFVLMVLLFGTAGAAWKMVNGSSSATQETDLVSVAPNSVSAGSVTDGEQEETKSSSQSQDPPYTEKQFLFSGFAITAQLIGVLCISAFVVARTTCTFSSIGWRFDQVSDDLRAGLQSFLMVTPPVLVMNMMLVKWTNVPYDHPIQKMIEGYPWLLGVAFWQACIVAPISEEFAFRTLLIGWFESIHFGFNKAVAFLFGIRPEQRQMGTEDQTPTERVRVPMIADGGYAVDASSHATADVPIGSRSEECSEYQPPWWPSLVSGVLFGLAHASYGVSWVNLSILGIVLGRLYQRRQSLIPVILVHFLFNSLSILMFGIKLAMPESFGQ
jgi:membrane protease YdiL (CAAX protease family)